MSVSHGIGEVSGEKLTSDGGVTARGEALAANLVGGAGEFPPAVAVVDISVGDVTGEAAGVSRAEVVGTGGLVWEVGREQRRVQTLLGVVEEGLLLLWLNCSKVI